MAKATGDRRETMTQIPKVSRETGPSLTHDQVRQLAARSLQNMIAPFLGAAVPVLLQMDMAIYCTDDQTGFITSNRPCSWFDPEAYKLPPLYRSPALGSKTIEVTMPISPRPCLCLNWQGFSGYQDAPTALLDEFNRRHRFHCKNQYVVRQNTTNPYWFYEKQMPDDAWERRYATKHEDEDSHSEVAQYRPSSDTQRGE